MGWCWRWLPLVAVVIVLAHATSWFGLVTPAQAAATTAPVGALGMLSDAGSVVDQIFAWLILLLGVQMICSILGFAMKEIRLRRMYDRPGNRWPRSTRTVTVQPPPVGRGQPPRL